MLYMDLSSMDALFVGIRLFFVRKSESELFVGTKGWGLGIVLMKFQSNFSELWGRQRHAGSSYNYAEALEAVAQAQVLSFCNNDFWNVSLVDPSVWGLAALWGLICVFLERGWGFQSTFVRVPHHFGRRSIVMGTFWWRGRLTALRMGKAIMAATMSLWWSSRLTAHTCGRWFLVEEEMT